MDGHSFYTHFQTLNKDDPRNVFIRRVECHLLAGETAARNPYPALPSVPRHRRRPIAPPDTTALSGGERDLLEEWLDRLAASRS
jgi:hypothetical protein